MADAVTENLTPAPLPRHQIGKDPEHFTNQNAQADRDLSDQIELTAAIENAFADGKTARQVQSTLAGRPNFLAQTERAVFVANVRATLGIPSRATADGEAEFQAWAAERTARRDAARDPEPAAEARMWDQIKAMRHSRPRRAQPSPISLKRNSPSSKRRRRHPRRPHFPPDLPHDIQ